MKPWEIEVEPLTGETVLAASEVEAACLSTAWTAAQLASLPNEAVYLVAKQNGSDTVFGIGSLYCIPPEAELQNLATLPSARRNGVAQAILDGLFAQAKERGCDCVFLEVACDNASAIALYEKNAFSTVGRRKGFYRGVDALLMKKTL